MIVVVDVDRLNIGSWVNSRSRGGYGVWQYEFFGVYVSLNVRISDLGVDSNGC